MNDSCIVIYDANDNIANAGILIDYIPKWEIFEIKEIWNINN